MSRKRIHAERPATISAPAVAEASSSSRSLKRSRSEDPVADPRAFIDDEASEDSDAESSGEDVARPAASDDSEEAVSDDAPASDNDTEPDSYDSGSDSDPDGTQFRSLNETEQQKKELDRVNKLRGHPRYSKLY